MPFYVSPEQLMKDRADFARKGIARGRGLVVVQYVHGLLFCSENTSPSLHKISELYDRLAFAAVGRYNEFENLRIAGVRLADMRGYSYDRRDVTGRGLANAYAQTLGTIFSSGAEKPYEVEIFVAEVGNSSDEDQIYRLTYDGSVADVRGFAVMGGAVEPVAEYLQQHYTDGLDLESALRLAVEALGHDGTTVRRVDGDRLEVAVLDRTRSQPRKFRRIPKSQLMALFASPPPESDADGDGDGDTAVSTGSTGGEGDSAVSTSSTGGDADGGATDDPDELIGDLPDDRDNTTDE
jgi:proteasome alpha subunit